MRTMKMLTLGWISPLKNLLLCGLGLVLGSTTVGADQPCLDFAQFHEY